MNSSSYLKYLIDNELIRVVSAFSDVLPVLMPSVAENPLCGLYGKVRVNDPKVYPLSA